MDANNANASDQGSELECSYGKQILESIDLENLSPSSCDDCSVISSSSWDSDSEYVMASNDSKVSSDSECIELQKEDFSDMEQEDNHMILEEANKSYDELLKKLIEQEEEQKVSKLKLQLCEEENERLRKEIVKRSSETHQLEVQLEVAQTNVAKLENEFQGYKLIITWYEADVTRHIIEGNKLRDEILKAQEVFSLEKDTLQSDIVGLSEMKMQLTSKLEESESKISALENIIREYEAEKLKQEELLATQQMVLQDEITYLKEEHGAARDIVEAMNEHIELLDAQKMNLLDEITSLNEELSEERHVVDAVNKELELQVTQQLVLQDEISSLKKELCEERDAVEAMNEQIELLDTEKIDLQGEITSLNEELGEVRFVVEALNENIKLLETQQMDLQDEITSLNEELSEERHAVEIVNRKLELQVTQQLVLQDEISSLRKELGQKRHDMEAVKNEFDEAGKLMKEIFAKMDEIVEHHQQELSKLI